MRIESIYVENFQGLRHANLALSAPITMVCGLNGAGKSSMKEAVGLALGESARIAHKKDYAKLVGSPGAHHVKACFTPVSGFEQG